MNKKEKTVLGIFLISILLIIYFVLVHTGIVDLSKYSTAISPPNAVVPSFKKEHREEKINLIALHISGAVKKPGLYRIPRDSRLGELIIQAGGLYDTAYTEVLNLAMKLSDGSKIVIPEKHPDVGLKIPEESGKRVITNRDIERYIAQKDKTSSVLKKNIEGNKPAQFNNASGKININTAGVDLLDKLPSIGPATAKRIIQYRAEHGLFKKIGDIKNVPRIGPKIFEIIKSGITVE